MKSFLMGGGIHSRNTFLMGGGKKTLTQLIKSLFSNNEVGFAYDPNDLTTLYQDAEGTIPVTAVGQLVGLMKDKSGRNNHAYQTTSASRPILRKNFVTGANYLWFDGIDDFLVTNSIDFTATDKISLFACVRKFSDTPVNMVLELSDNINYNTSAFYITAGLDYGVNGYTSTSRGSVSISQNTSAQATTYLAPDSAVLSITHDISGSLSTIRRNGVAGVSGTENKGTGNFGKYPLYIGRRGGKTLPFIGRIYGLIGVGKLVSESETVAIEKELAKQLGVTI